MNCALSHVARLNTHITFRKALPRQMTGFNDRLNALPWTRVLHHNDGSRGKRNLSEIIFEVSDTKKTIAYSPYLRNEKGKRKKPRKCSISRIYRGAAVVTVRLILDHFLRVLRWCRRYHFGETFYRSENGFHSCRSSNFGVYDRKTWLLLTHCQVIT